MNATIPDGESHCSRLDGEHLDGDARRRIVKVVAGMRAAVTAVVVVLILVLVTVLVTAGNKLHHDAAHGKICGSVEITGDQTVLEDYTSCVTIEGNLRIQLIEHNETRPFVGLSNLVQVTGYVIIYRLSHVRTLRHLLPRLAVIRGRELFHGYSLVIFGNIFLQEANLWNLTHVLRGAVRVEKNLCSGPPNRWDLLSPSPALNVIQDYGVCIYPVCEEERDCENVTTTIHTHCTTYGGCYQGPQCHEECVGGCHLPHDPDACVACKNYRDGHSCVPDCSKSATNKVHHLDYRCIPENECAQEPWKLDTKDGPQGTERLVCVRCNDNCYGTCRGTKVTNANLGRQVHNCQRLEGNLEIMVSGGSNLTQQLEENLGQLQVVTGYLKVYGSNTLFSLNFLSNLEKIGGDDLVHGRYSLYVLDNEKLQELWDWKHRSRSLKITRGMLFFQHNPSLCRELINELASRAQLTQASRVHVSPAEDTGPCYTSDLQVDCVPRRHGKLNVSWKYHYYGRDDRFVIGYYLYYREAPKKITLYQDRDACNDNILWERLFREYERNKRYEVSVDNLKPYTQYALYVDVYYTDAVKNASRSTIQYVTTTMDKPSPVREVKATLGKNISTQLLSWREPAVPNGVLKMYQVKYGRLKLSRLHLQEDRHDVCEDMREEPQSKTPPSMQNGGEEDKGTGCCACPGSAVSLSKEDRRFDHQLDINFQTFIWQNLLCKRVSDANENKPIPASVSLSKPLTQERKNFTSSREASMNQTDITAIPASQAAAFLASEKRHGSRQRKRRSSFHPAVTQDGIDKQMSAEETETGREQREEVEEEEEEEEEYKEEEEEEEEDDDDELEEEMVEDEECENIDTNGNDTALCDVRTMTTINTHVTLMGLAYFTQYRVLVRACNGEDSDCSDWSVLDITTPPDMSIYKIKNFKAQQIKINETKQSAVKSKSNSSEVVTLPRPTDAMLLLSWDPPIAPKEDILAYIIEYQIGETPKKKICLPQEKLLDPTYRFPLQKFGTYTLQIRVRSPSGDGPPTTQTVRVEKHNVYWAVLVAFLCGGLLGICIMEVALWTRRRRTVPETPTHNHTYGERLLEQGLERLDKDFVIGSDTLKVELNRKLGQGFFGKVYLGLLKLPAGKEQQVAVKTPNAEATYTDKKRFLDEAVVMQHIRSNFMVRLIGVVDSYPPIYVVMEYMELGDLKSFLITNEGKSLTDEKMVEMAVEAADGMAYLEAKNWVHRDLAARNCMLGIVEQRLTLKIGDFGLTRYVTADYYKKQSGGMLPFRWMAPESLVYCRYSSRSDVWSYGVLLWELATGGRQPYEGNLEEEVGDFILSGKRLGPPDKGPDFFYPLMLRCWKAVPKQRPTFKRIVQRLLPMTSKKYLEYFQRVSFFHNSGSSDHESPVDIDEGFNASGSSQEDAEAGYSGSLSSSVPPFHYFNQESQAENEDFVSWSSGGDTAVEENLVCMTPEDPYERSSSVPLSCITSHVGRLTPSSDVPNKKLFFRTNCVAET